MKRPELYDDDVANKLAKALGRGKANAITATKLVEAVPALRNTSNLRSYMEYLRRHRLMLVAADTTSGYWICETVEEFRDFYRTFRSRAMEILTTCAALERKYPALLTEPMDFEEEER
jgi:hypothetical protein